MSARIVVGKNKAEVASALTVAGYPDPVFHLEERIDRSRWLFIVTAAEPIQVQQKRIGDVFIGKETSKKYTLTRAQRDAVLKSLGR